MPKAIKHVLNKYEHMSAEELFTDREEPRKAFWDLYDSMENGDYEVLTYYGIGGIGKTSLLYKLCEELKEKMGENKVPNYAFYSFESSATKEDFLFNLSRRMMLYNKKLKFPLFDTAFARIANDEKKDLNKYIENTKKSFMDNRIVDTAISIAGQFVPGLESAAKVVDIIFGLVDSKNAEKVCESGDKSILYNEIQNEKKIEKIKDKLQDYFYEDVYDVMEQNDTPYVIFIDGYENYVSLIKHGNLSNGRDNWISKKLVVIPNVLWVIAGREKLKWREEILPNEHQHRMGELSELDVIEFFKKAEIEDEELIKVLYKLTNGTPVYLDLCAKTYYDVLKTKQPEIEDFGRDTTELVERYLKNMNNDDQNIMIMLSFLPKVWDFAMAEMVAKALDYGAYIDNLHKLVNLSLFERVDNGIKMHESTRVVIKEFHMDRQERIGTAIIQYLTGILLTSKDSMDYIHRCIQFAESMELCDTKVVSDEDMYKILHSISEGLNNVDEFITGEYIFSTLENRLDICGYSSEVITACKSCRCVNLRNLGRFNDALEQAKNALIYIERHPEISTDHIIQAFNNIGNIYMEVADYQNALYYLNLVYEMQLELRGERDIKTASAKQNVAKVFFGIGQYKIAKKIFEQVYEIFEELCDKDDKNTIFARGDIANVCFMLGEYNQSYIMFEQVYEKMKEILGEEDPDTVLMLNNMAAACRYSDHTEWCMYLCDKAYKSAKKVLGNKHPATIKALSNLAIQHGMQGEIERALELFESAYKLGKEVLGEEHQDTISTLHDMSIAYCQLGDYVKAKNIALQAYELSKIALEKGHPDRIAILTQLIHLCKDLGEYAEAKDLYEELYEVKKKKIADDPADAFLTLNELACTCFILEEYEYIIKLYEQSYGMMEQIMGSSHSYVIQALYNMASAYFGLEEYEKSKNSYEKLYSILIKTPGVDGSFVATVEGILLGFNSMPNE